jgi:indoleamine 2,3-dioxygenase
MKIMFPVPNPEDYDVSLENAFLPNSPPLERLPDSYYEPWEHVMTNMHGLILSKRLREVVDTLPILSTDRLSNVAEWRRAYSILAFITHGYIWGGWKPADRIPPSISIPFGAACKRLELPPVATYAGLVLWNWKPIFANEPVDTLANLDTIDTFTGSLDEKWFYLISIAIESRGAPIIPMMLRAIKAARDGDRDMVIRCLQSFAERLSELKDMLAQMYDNCDPHVFYYRIRPFLAGSKNMAAAGLPRGVIFDNGGAINRQKYVQFSGGSNAQSSIIQFFDIVLGVEHRSTGETKTGTSDLPKSKPSAPSTNFILEMRKYMPGPHARFLRDAERVANIRTFVEERSFDRGLTFAYDACLAMLRSFRDTHIQIVSRYIIIKSREAASAAKREATPATTTKKVDLAHRSKPVTSENIKKDLKGTGGTALIPFLRQARDETGEPAVDEWTRRLLSKKGVLEKEAAVITTTTRQPLKRDDSLKSIEKLWQVDGNGGGLCTF